jgi:hypothetical protein
MAHTDFGEEQILRERRRSWLSFEYVMLFAALHIALTLVCIALAFLGGVKLLALLIWVGGSVAMIAAFVVRWTSSTRE